MCWRQFLIIHKKHDYDDDDLDPDYDVDDLDPDYDDDDGDHDDDDDHDDGNAWWSSQPWNKNCKDRSITGPYIQT